MWKSLEKLISKENGFFITLNFKKRFQYTKTFWEWPKKRSIFFEFYCHLPYSRNVQEGTAICKWISWSFYSLPNAQFSGKGFWHDLKKSGDSELSFQPLAASAASPGRGRTYFHTCVTYTVVCKRIGMKSFSRFWKNHP